jgi:Domain of unknown function (DUF4352)
MFRVRGRAMSAVVALSVALAAGLGACGGKQATASSTTTLPIGTTTSTGHTDPMPFYVGDPISLGAISLQVLSIRDPALLTATPPAGRRFVSVDIEVTNYSKKPIDFDGSKIFTLFDNKRHDDRPTTVDGVPAFAARLATRQKLRGELVFALTGDIDAYYVHFNGNPLNTDSIYVEPRPPATAATTARAPTNPGG